MKKFVIMSVIMFLLGSIVSLIYMPGQEIGYKQGYLKGRPNYISFQLLPVENKNECKTGDISMKELSSRSNTGGIIYEDQVNDPSPMYWNKETCELYNIIK